MKKIALYILCGVMALFTSCDPSLLDLQNENTLSTGIYWKTESDIEAGVIAVYGMFYRFGLIDVPDKVKEKMGRPKDRKK